MIKRELTDDVINAMEATPAEVVTYLQDFKPNEYYEQLFDVRKNPTDTTKLFAYVAILKKEGLDIGKGDAQFGYRMPVPAKGSAHRYLQVFRRK